MYSLALSRPSTRMKTTNFPDRCFASTPSSRRAKSRPAQSLPSPRWPLGRRRTAGTTGTCTASRSGAGPGACASRANTPRPPPVSPCPARVFFPPPQQGRHHLGAPRWVGMAWPRSKTNCWPSSNRRRHRRSDLKWLETKRLLRALPISLLSAPTTAP